MQQLRDIRAVIIDLSGVLYVDGHALPGSVNALTKLQASGMPHCFLTNTTRQTQAQLQAGLQKLGFEVPTKLLITAASAAHQYLQTHQLRPHLLIHPGLATEFASLDCRQPNCVVIGDAGQAFSYDNLNAAFRTLSTQSDAPLIAMGSNRYFMETDGLSLDMGPFVAALEYATGRKAIITGKPAPSFYQTALDIVGASAREAVMIGDDPENDIVGAQVCGLSGALVRTGKYRSGDEHNLNPQPDMVFDDFADAIDCILSQTS